MPEVITRAHRRVKLSISGRVQGVFFRQSAKRKAQELGLSGHVKNLPDGTVEAVAEGDLESVAAFITWCHRGPIAASVKAVGVEEQKTEGELPSPFAVSR